MKTVQNILVCSVALVLFFGGLEAYQRVKYYRATKDESLSGATAVSEAQ